MKPILSLSLSLSQFYGSLCPALALSLSLGGEGVVEGVYLLQQPRTTRYRAPAPAHTALYEMCFNLKLSGNAVYYRA